MREDCPFYKHDQEFITFFKNRATNAKLPIVFEALLEDARISLHL